MGGSKLKTICFVTTGDIAAIATAKRALGLANPLSDLGWMVHVIMEDTDENRHRAAMECDERVKVHFMSYTSPIDEKNKKSSLLEEIKPDYVYLCAFVFRNMVSVNFKCKKLVEHSELRSAITDVSWWRRGYELFSEYYSLVYADGILNASVYLQKLNRKRAGRILREKLPMLYFPYAYNGDLCKMVVRKDCVGWEKSDGDVFVTYLGSLSRAYRTIDIAKAVHRIGRVDIKLLLLGDGDDRQRIQAYVAENNLGQQVWMPGYVNEELIPTFFSLTDVFVLPMNDTVQDKARCPSKLYMYLPYGKPIVTAKVGEPYEVLKDNGIYYATGSVDDLSRAILTALSKKTLGLDSRCHEWTERAKQFDEWIKRSFGQAGI